MDWLTLKFLQEWAWLYVLVILILWAFVMLIRNKRDVVVSHDILNRWYKLSDGRIASIRDDRGDSFKLIIRGLDEKEHQTHNLKEVKGLLDGELPRASSWDLERFGLIRNGSATDRSSVPVLAQPKGQGAEKTHTGSQNEDDFTTSAVVGYVTNNPILGGMVGGSLTGGMVGAALSEDD